MEEEPNAKLPPREQRATPHEQQRLIQIADYESINEEVIDDRLVELGWLVRVGKQVKASSEHCDANGRPKWIDSRGRFLPEWSCDATARSLSTIPEGTTTPLEFLFVVTGLVLGILIAWDIVAVISAEEGTVGPIAVKLVAESVALKLAMLCVPVGLHRIIKNTAK